MPNKSLGQHWLRDRRVLEYIIECGGVTKADTVLEIGPGLGTLTSALLAKAKQVVAVEFDKELARKLPGQFPGTKLEVIQGDILSFNLGHLPTDYKVVANLPYYITSKIIQTLLTASSPPLVAVLLVQKEVARRLAARPGDMSLLALSAQVFSEVSLGEVVPAKFFTPPPKVDSQVVILSRRTEPLVPPDQQADFFRMAKAGFSQKRKKLRSSLAGGLQMEKTEVEKLLGKTSIDPDTRAEDLGIEDWQTLSATIKP